MNNVLLLFVLLFTSLYSHAQTTDTTKIYRVGIFASLYLDSTFEEDKYKFDKQMPRHILPGLDFVEGSLMAFDSISNGKRFKVSVFDLRSSSQTIAQLKPN